MQEVLKHCMVDKFSGSGSVYPWALWEAREYDAGPLAEIFESSITMGELLEVWRVADAVLRNNKGCKEKSADYR